MRCVKKGLHSKGSHSALLLSKATYSSALARLVMRERESERARKRARERERERESEREKDILVLTQDPTTHIFATALRVKEVYL